VTAALLATIAIYLAMTAGRRHAAPVVFWGEEG
jgi:hypothetical protein